MGVIGDFCIIKRFRRDGMIDEGVFIRWQAAGQNSLFVDY